MKRFLVLSVFGVLLFNQGSMKCSVSNLPKDEMALPKRIEMQVDKTTYWAKEQEYNFQRIKIKNISSDTLITWMADSAIAGKTDKQLFLKHIFHRRGDFNLCDYFGHLAGEKWDGEVPEFLIKMLAPNEEFTYLVFQKEGDEEPFEERVVAIPYKIFVDYLNFKPVQMWLYQKPETVILNW